MISKSRTTKRRSKKHLKPCFNAENVQQMYEVELNIETFQRTARKFFKTNCTGNLLQLENSDSSKVIWIDFSPDSHDYLRIRAKRPLIFLLSIKRPRTNRDLFIKILKHKIL